MLRCSAPRRQRAIRGAAFQCAAPHVQRHGCAGGMPALACFHACRVPWGWGLSACACHESGGALVMPSAINKHAIQQCHKELCKVPERQVAWLPPWAGISSAWGVSCRSCRPPAVALLQSWQRTSLSHTLSRSVLTLKADPEGLGLLRTCHEHLQLLTRPPIAAGSTRHTVQSHVER